MPVTHRDEDAEAEAAARGVDTGAGLGPLLRSADTAYSSSSRLAAGSGVALLEMAGHGVAEGARRCGLGS